jgi:carbon-monoxide dehydrogenase medium subunit
VHHFQYASPVTLDETLKLLANEPQARLLAGGTDLVVQMKARRRQPPVVVNAKRIPELLRISYDSQTGLTLGAAVTCHEIAAHAAIRAHYPSLTAIAKLIGGVPIQGRASLGGNLCNSAPSADSVPLMIALSGTAHIATPSGSARTIPLEHFCTAPGENVLRPGELLTHIHFPPPLPHSAAAYLRFIPRNEMDIAVAGAAVYLERANGHIARARIALSSVAPTPLFLPHAAEALAGLPPNTEAFESAATLARNSVTPITDMRGTAEYRAHLVQVLVRRTLEAAAQQIA